MLKRVFYIGLNKLKTDIWARIFIIIEIILMLYLLNIMIGTWRHCTYILNVVDKMNLGNAYHCSNYDGTIYEGKSYTVGEIEQLGTSWKSGQGRLPLIKYNDAIINNIHLPLNNGLWFTKYTGKEIPIILSYSYAEMYDVEVGDIIERELNNQTISFEVIGILSRYNYYVELNITSTELIWNDLFTAYDIVGIVNDDYLHGSKQKSKIIFIDEQSNKKQLLIEELKNQGFITSSQELTLNTKKNITYKLKEQLFMWILLLGIIIATLTSNNVLEKIYEEDEFATYYMLGLKWSNCIMIEVIRSVSQVLIASIAAILLIQITYGRNIYKTLILDGYNYIISAGIILVIYMISSLWIVIELLKTNPIELIRRNE